MTQKKMLSELQEIMTRVHELNELKHVLFPDGRINVLFGLSYTDPKGKSAEDMEGDITLCGMPEDLAKAIFEMLNLMPKVLPHLKRMMIEKNINLN